VPALGAPEQLGESTVLTRSECWSRALHGASHGAVIGRQLAGETVKGFKIAAANANLTVLNAPVG
jgi:hypothetical protein